jgi:hypothetical protein
MNRVVEVGGSVRHRGITVGRMKDKRSAERLQIRNSSDSLAMEEFRAP